MLTTLLLIPLAGALVIATMPDHTYFTIMGRRLFPKHLSILPYREDGDRDRKLALFTTLVTFIVSMVM